MKTYQTMFGGELQPVGSRIEVFNPANGEIIGLAARSSAEEVEAAVQSAKHAQSGWADMADQERKQLLMQVAQVLTDNTDYLASWITKEQGKPLAGPGSLFEMQACVAWTQVPASLDLPAEVVFEDDSRRDELHRTAIGVVAAIAPWNWPLMIAIWQIIPALRMGNTVVIKPSEYTTIGTLEMVRLINAVLPAGVLNVISGDGRIGAQLVEHKDIDKVMFTGSTATGRRIIEASAVNLSRLTLELGGNDAAIVLPDVDAAAIAEGLFWGAFINMGQTCACAKRLYVHADVYDQVIDALAAFAAQMPMGDGSDEGIVLGPLQNEMQRNKVIELVEDAKANGATVVCGGEKPSGDGLFYPITLIKDIADGSRLVDEEQFGPVLPIIKYCDVDQAIASANGLDAGLGASVWSNDTERAHAVASKLQAGTVWVNQHGAIHPMVPFGGSKGSGYGVEFGIEGLKSLSQSKIISVKK